MTPFFKDYRTETMIRMVFESNTIENEGLDLTGTKRLFSEIFQPSFIKFESSKPTYKKDIDITKSIIEDIKKLTENLDITDFNDNKLVIYKDKKKYIEAMKEFYQKKKISEFISVVSRAFLKQVEEINDNLELAGKDIIEPLELSKEFKEKIEKELSLY